MLLLHWGCFLQCVSAVPTLNVRVISRIGMKPIQEIPRSPFQPFHTHTHTHTQPISSLCKESNQAAVNAMEIFKRLKFMSKQQGLQRNYYWSSLQRKQQIELLQETTKILDIFWIALRACCGCFSYSISHFNKQNYWAEWGKRKREREGERDSKKNAFVRDRRVSVWVGEIEKS